VTYIHFTIVKREEVRVMLEEDIHQRYFSVTCKPRDHKSSK